MQREDALQYAYYQLLNGNVLYNSNPVQISDFMIANSAPNLYILFGNQTAESASNLTNYAWDMFFEIYIVAKQPTNVSRKDMNDVHQQVSDLVIGSKPTFLGLQQQTGWQILNVKEKTSTFQSGKLLNDTGTLVVKVVTFYQLMNKL